MKLALAGGGSALDSAFIDQRFAEWIGPKGKMLYLPIAIGRITANYDAADQWLRSVFEPMGVESISTWTDLTRHTVSEFEYYDGIYMGGGNAYTLRHELQSTGFFEAIKCYAANGYPIYGGSAGAAVLGKSIATVAHLDVNEKGIRDLTGLNLAEGCSVWVHYREADRPLIQNFISGESARLILLSERAGLTIEDGEFRSEGTDPVYIVDQDHWKVIT